MLSDDFELNQFLFSNMPSINKGVLYSDVLELKEQQQQNFFLDMKIASRRLSLFRCVANFGLEELS